MEQIVTELNTLGQAAFFTLLGVVELALLVLLLCAYLYRKQKSVSLQLEKLKVKYNSLTKEKPDFKLYLENMIADTRDKLQHCDAGQIDLLEKRLLFLQAELAALNEPDHGENYWQHICERIGAIGKGKNEPEETTPAPEQKTEEFNGFIPTLDNVAYEPEGIGAEKDDITRLRKIIDRQFESIDSLKHELSSNNANQPVLRDLNRKLEEMQASQDQLMLCIQTLEQENERLHDLLQDRKAEQPDKEQVYKEKLQHAHVLIKKMEMENREQVKKILLLHQQLKKPKAKAVSSNTKAVSEAASALQELTNTSAKNDKEGKLDEYLQTQARGLAGSDDFLDFEDMEVFSKGQKKE